MTLEEAYEYRSMRDLDAGKSLREVMWSDPLYFENTRQSILGKNTDLPYFRAINMIALHHAEDIAAAIEERDQRNLKMTTK